MMMQAKVRCTDFVESALGKNMKCMVCMYVCMYVCMLCNGMVWYGMVWYRMVWYGLVWYVFNVCMYV